MSTAGTTSARYSWGGDEHLFVEMDEAMSLEAYFRSMAVVTALRERRPEGVIDICPANASYQVRFDPDVLAPDRLEALLREIEAQVGDATDFEFETRIVEIPVLYGDPWTHETLMRFRDRHQDPEATDLEYAARINGFDDVQCFIDAHSGAPWTPCGALAAIRCSASRRRRFTTRAKSCRISRTSSASLSRETS
ncbi:MAG: carboxyltransferase domain-containing protein [Solirubrobacterales bacterium]|nr:carboxyltransferase domain-containing protein [Solirubrobacterales bacterium]